MTLHTWPFIHSSRYLLSVMHIIQPIHTWSIRTPSPSVLHSATQQTWPIIKVFVECDVHLCRRRRKWSGRLIFQHCKYSCVQKVRFIGCIVCKHQVLSGSQWALILHLVVSIEHTCMVNNLLLWSLERFSIHTLLLRASTQQHNKTLFTIIYSMWVSDSSNRLHRVWYRDWCWYWRKRYN